MPGIYGFDVSDNAWLAISTNVSPQCVLRCTSCGKLAYVQSLCIIQTEFVLPRDGLRLFEPQHMVVRVEDFNVGMGDMGMLPGLELREVGANA